jgi:hypothetical protein
MVSGEHLNPERFDKCQDCDSSKLLCVTWRVAMSGFNALQIMGLLLVSQQGQSYCGLSQVNFMSRGTLMRHFGGLTQLPVRVQKYRWNSRNPEQ